MSLRLEWGRCPRGIGVRCRARAARLAVAGALILLTACRTGDRLWRVSPFEGRASSDRVNLWPLAYHNGDETSVLWPLFDVDEDGFALRPLVAHDESAWSVAFPLAWFDAESGEGWFGPFYSWRDNRGLLVLANVGPRFSWVGPVWWTDQGRGLFPLAYFGPGFSWAGPVWWSGATAGLFPLAAFGDLNYVGPAWWSGAGEGHGVFPLYGRDLFGSDVDHVGPVWWESEAETFEGGLWPLVGWAEGGRRFSLLPLYSHELGDDATRRTYLLGLGNVERSSERAQSWWIPFYWHRAVEDREDTVLLPAFWKRTRGERTDVYTLLGNRSADPDAETLNVYPLWWSSARGTSAWKMLFPLFWYEREDDARTLITPLGGRGWSATGATGFVNVLGPLYHHSEDATRGRTRTAFLWPLYDRRRDGDEVRTDVAGLWSRTRDPGSAETVAGLGLVHARSTEAGASHRLWPLWSWSSEAEVPGIVYRLTLFGRHSHGAHVSTRLWPLADHTRSPSGSEWNALFGLVHHDRRGGDEPVSERTWAWPLFSTTHGGAEPSFAERTALLGWSDTASGARLQLGMSLLHSRRSVETPERSTASSRTLLLFTHEEERFVGPLVPAAAPLARQNRVEHESRGFLFSAFVSRSETFRAWRPDAVSAEEARVLRATWLGTPREGLPDREAARAVLAARGVAPARDDPQALHDAIAAFADAHTEPRERRRVRLPLLWDWERTDDELDWSAPLGLARYSRDPERTRFSLLYYGYRRETTNGTTTRDLFPFVSWDTEPDGTRVSFLWRVFRYERDGARRGGHVLFVPWGDA